MAEYDDQVLTVSEVVGGLDRLDGRTVRVRGVLVVTADAVRLAAAAPDEAAGDVLTVDHPGLVDRLLATVPVWVGGPYLYRDAALVTGTVTRSPSPSLTALTALTVTRKGVDYEVRPGG